MVCLQRKPYKDMYKYEGISDNRLDAINNVMQRRQPLPSAEQQPDKKKFQ